LIDVEQIFSVGRDVWLGLHQRSWLQPGIYPVQRFHCRGE